MIEEAKVTDHQAIVSLILKSYEQYKHVFETNRWKKYQKELTNSVNNPAIAQLLVAKLNNKIIGTIFLYKNGYDAYENEVVNLPHPVFRFLAVHPDARGYKIAQRLIHSSIETLRKSEESFLYLHTSPLMENALKLYNFLGFLHDRKYDYEKNGEPILSYRLSLKGETHDKY